jgi:hypothetical protein
MLKKLPQLVFGIKQKKNWQTKIKINCGSAGVNSFDQKFISSFIQNETCAPNTIVLLPK